MKVQWTRCDLRCATAHNHIAETGHNGNRQIVFVASCSAQIENGKRMEPTKYMRNKNTSKCYELANECSQTRREISEEVSHFIFNGMLCGTIFIIWLWATAGVGSRTHPLMAVCDARGPSCSLDATFVWSSCVVSDFSPSIARHRTVHLLILNHSVYFSTLATSSSRLRLSW